MEIDITGLIEAFESYAESAKSFSDSIANSGLSNIGQVTWRNAVKAAVRYMYVNDANRDSFISWLAEFGAWDWEELEAQADVEINAMFLQFVSGDYQERRRAAERGELVEYEENHGGRLYQSADRWFYYVGC